MKDLKAAKKLLKRSKKHPDWYSQDDIKYAKMVKKKEKDAKRKFESESK